MAVSHIWHCTRPDLSFTVAALARSLHAPSSRHLSLAKRVLRYVRGTMRYGLRFNINQRITPTSMRAAVNADWGGCTTSRRSTSGYIFAVNGSPIFCKSKLQTVVALSSGEAEYVVLSACLKEITWLRRLFYELVHRQECTDDSVIPPTIIEIDISAAMSIAANNESTKLTKHIAIRFHHVRHNIVHRIIFLQKVTSNCQVADTLTERPTQTSLNRLVTSFSLNKEEESNM